MRIRTKAGFSGLLLLLITNSITVWASIDGIIDPDNRNEFVIESSGYSPGKSLPRLFGHNLSPTSYTLEGGEVSAGSYALALGIGDNWTLGTSPWMITQYNMPCIISRFGFDTNNEAIQRVSLEFDYFKTFPYFFNTYNQESTMTRLTVTHQFSSQYTMHLTAGYQYFMNANTPFSLRMISNSTDMKTISLSSLHEVSFTSRDGLMFEAGMLGVNYPIPYFHTGISLYKKWRGGFFQIGVSGTFLALETTSASDIVSGWADVLDPTADIGPRVFERKLAIHPEIQLQFEI